MSSIFEWIGSLSGLLGAWLLATHSNVSKYGWLAYLLANVGMIIFALSIRAYGLLVQQLGFTVTTCLGLRRSGMLAAMFPRWRTMAKVTR